jgi:hypothetical protein
MIQSPFAFRTFAGNFASLRVEDQTAQDDYGILRE